VTKIPRRHDLPSGAGGRATGDRHWVRRLRVWRRDLNGRDVTITRSAVGLETDPRGRRVGDGRSRVGIRVIKRHVGAARWAPGLCRVLATCGHAGPRPGSGPRIPSTAGLRPAALAHGGCARRHPVARRRSFERARAMACRLIGWRPWGEAAAALTHHLASAFQDTRRGGHHPALAPLRQRPRGGLVFHVDAPSLQPGGQCVLRPRWRLCSVPTTAVRGRRSTSPRCFNRPAGRPVIAAAFESRTVS